ncbi:MAG: hypothetical protein ABGW78_15170 [Pirellulales bacterium]
MSPIVNPAALFSFRFPCQKRSVLWPASKWEMDDTCRIKSLASVVGVPDLLSLWLAWNEDGLAIRAVAQGVGNKRWCQPTKPEDSDGLHLWLATRPTGDSHRAGRFCRRIALLPTGGGKNATKPIAVPAVIPRTSEVPAELPTKSILMASSLMADGWEITSFISALALPNWDPIEIPRLGFFAALIDRRLGKIPCFAPPEFPWESDPTTWAELQLHSDPAPLPK